MDFELDNYAEAYIGIHVIFAHMCDLFGSINNCFHSSDEIL